jgi:hypothetical protein
MIRRIHYIVKIFSQIDLIVKSNSNGKQSYYIWKGEDLSKIMIQTNKSEQPLKKRKIEKETILPPLRMILPKTEIQPNAPQLNQSVMPKDFEVILSPNDDVNYYFK